MNLFALHSVSYLANKSYKYLALNVRCCGILQIDFCFVFFLLIIILCLFVYLFVCLSLSFLIFDRFAPLNSLSLFWRDGFRFYCVSPDPKTTFWSMVFSSVSTTEGHNCVKCLFLLYFSSFFLHSSMHIQGKVERETKKKRIKGF